MRRTLLLFIYGFFILFLQAKAVSAQDRWFEAMAGIGYTQPETKGSPWSYKGRILPNAGINCYIALSPTFSLKTGVLYQQKGLFTEGSYKPDSVYQLQQFSSKNTYHFVNIPFQLAMNVAKNDIGTYRVAAGMSYSFLAAANSEIEVNSYYDDNRKDKTTVKYNHLVAAQPKDDIKGLPEHEGTPLYFFIPSLRLDISYLWQERFVFSVFYEYNLSDVRMRTVNDSKMNLHYAGVSAGIRFW